MKEIFKSKRVLKSYHFLKEKIIDLNPELLEKKEVTFDLILEEKDLINNGNKQINFMKKES